MEFVAAVTRPLGKEPPLLDRPAALREAEELLLEFPILYPNDEVVRSALQNAASVSSLLLTSEVLITDIPEKKAPMGGGMPLG